MGMVDADGRPVVWPSRPSPRPRFMTGDLVNTRQLTGIGGNYPPVAMVISVRQANHVPDAAERGMGTMYRWVYWCASSDLKIFGPIGQDWLNRA